MFQNETFHLVVSYIVRKASVEPLMVSCANFSEPVDYLLGVVSCLWKNSQSVSVLMMFFVSLLHQNIRPYYHYQSTRSVQALYFGEETQGTSSKQRQAIWNVMRLYVYHWYICQFYDHTLVPVWPRPIQRIAQNQILTQNERISAQKNFIIHF